MNRPRKKFWSQMTKKEWIAACREACERAKLPREQRPADAPLEKAPPKKREGMLA